MTFFNSIGMHRHSVMHYIDIIHCFDYVNNETEDILKKISK